VKQSVRNRLKPRQRRVAGRIDKANWNGQSPMLATLAVQLELAERTQALSAGGIGTMQQLVRHTGRRTKYQPVVPDPAVSSAAKPTMC
jgi:hypothetical protein